MDERIRWLHEVAGPVIRFRAATELGSPDDDARMCRERALLASGEVQRWLELLRRSDHVHSSAELAAENGLAKLSAYGMTAEFREFRDILDAVYSRFCSGGLNDYLRTILVPFLVAVGYRTREDVVEAAEQRVSTLHRFAVGSLEAFSNDEPLDDLFLSQREKADLGVPDRWRGHHIWKPAIADFLPNCYDFYLLAFLSGHEQERRDLLRFVATPRYQRLCQRREIEGSYGWDDRRRYCWSGAQMPYLHGFFGFEESSFSGSKFLLYMDLVSRMPDARELRWFREGLDFLKRFPSDSGRYRFPARYLPERKGGYFLYSGARMGLGEKGRSRLEIESTFRMLSLRENAGLYQAVTTG